MGLTRMAMLWLSSRAVAGTVKSRSANALLFVFCILLGACSPPPAIVGPSVKITKVPRAAPGGPDRFGTIEGLALNARPQQMIVLYARSGPWYVQPYADKPFTKIQHSRWTNSIHLGTEYAALLVEPDYVPPTSVAVLPNPGGGVVAVIVEPGEPPFWRTWWFGVICLLAAVLAAIFFYRMRMHQITHQLNVRFEERLAERTRIAQELHDTLLQGFVSASMQLHVAIDQLPDDSPAKPPLDRVQQLMARVIEEGRNTVRGLRPSDRSSHGLEQAFSQVPQELAMQDPVDFRMIVEGPPQPLYPVIRDEVYRIGREALVNAFRHSRASSIEIELESSANQLRVLVRDNGCGIDPAVLQTGREGHWGLSGMRERAERIGARLKVWSRAGAGTEVELSVPARIAFERTPSIALKGPQGKS